MDPIPPRLIGILYFYATLKSQSNLAWVGFHINLKFGFFARLQGTQRRGKENYVLGAEVLNQPH